MLCKHDSYFILGMGKLPSITRLIQTSILSACANTIPHECEVYVNI